MTSIVYVHGNGPKVRADLLKQQWDMALFGRDMGATSRMAYWAAVRYPAPLPDAASCETLPVPDSLAAADATDLAPPDAFMAATLAEARATRALTGEGAPNDAGLAAWLARMTYAGDALAEGERLDAVPSSAPEARELLGPVGQAAFRAFVKLAFKDVYAYFFGRDKEAMRAVVRSTLAGLEDPVVIVGHSLGSILSYDVLRESARQPLAIPLLVTVGSPLGVAEVQALVEQPLLVPAGVAAWRNASDPRDVVALDHTLRPEYAPPERCTDVFVRNDSATHHAICQYLHAAAVQEPIRAAIVTPP